MVSAGATAPRTAQSRGFECEQNNANHKYSHTYTLEQRGKASYQIISVAKNLSGNKENIQWLNMKSPSPPLSTLLILDQQNLCRRSSCIFFSLLFQGRSRPSGPPYGSAPVEQIINNELLNIDNQCIASRLSRNPPKSNFMIIPPNQRGPLPAFPWNCMTLNWIRTQMQNIYGIISTSSQNSNLIFEW